MVDQIGIRFVAEGQAEVIQAIRAYREVQTSTVDAVKAGQAATAGVTRDLKVLQTTYEGAARSSTAYKESLREIKRQVAALTGSSIQAASAAVIKLGRDMDKASESVEALAKAKQRAETAFAIAAQRDVALAESQTNLAASARQWAAQTDAALGVAGKRATELGATFSQLSAVQDNLAAGARQWAAQTDAALGVAGKRATELGATFSQLSAVQDNLAAGARQWATALNERLGVTGPTAAESGASSTASFAAIDAAEAAYERLRASIDPTVAASLKMAAAQRTVDEAVKRGVITADQAKTTMAQYTGALNNTSKANELLQRETQQLALKYNPTMAATMALKARQEELSRAMQVGVLSADQYQAKLAHLTTSFAGVGSGAAGVARFMNQYGENVRIAGVRTNNFGVYAQQVGYQVGDFFVQIQSGTSAFVAFGQQATQLAGLLPGVLGAVLGIGISVATALLAWWDRSEKAAKGANTLKGAVEQLTATTDAWLANMERIKDAKLGQTYGDLTTVVQDLSRAMAELDAASELRNLQNTLENLRTAVKPGWMDELMDPAAWAMDIAALTANLFQVLPGGGLMRNVPLNELRAGVEQIRAETKFAEQTGFQMGLAQYEGHIKGMEAAAKAGDRAQVVKLFRDFMVDATDMGAAADKVTNGGREIASQMLKVALATAEVQAFMDGSAEAAQRAADEAKKLSGTVAQGNAEALRWFDQQTAMQDALASAAAQAIVEAQRLQEQARKVAEELAKAHMEALGIARAPMAANIDAAAAAASILAARLGVSAGLARQIATLSSLTPDQRRIAVGVKTGAIPAVALKSLGITPEQGAALGIAPSDGAQPGAPTGMRVELPPVAGQNKPRGGRGGRDREERDPLADLMREMEQRQKLLGATDRQRAIMEETFKLQKQLADTSLTDAQIVKLAEKNVLLEEQERLYDRLQQTAKQVEDAFENAFVSFVTGASSAREAASNLLRSLANLWAQAAFRALLSGNSIFGSIFSPALVASANGNVFAGGNVVPFANGGVVSNPTLFPMSGGKTGLMGEAGAEAIMPLKRGRDGKLGVSAGTQQQRVAVDVRVYMDEDGNWRNNVRQIAQNEVRAAGPAVVRQSVRATYAANREERFR